MRVRRRRLALILLLALPFAAAHEGTRATPGSVQHLADDKISKTLASPPVPKPVDASNKDAPVDGLDGKPKVGPFIEKPKKPIAAVEDLTSGGRPISEDLVKGNRDKMDGWAVPDQDSVMADRGDRDDSKKGPTGTEGGISEKERERKAKEEMGDYSSEPKVPWAQQKEKEKQKAKEMKETMQGDSAVEGKAGESKSKSADKQKDQDAKKDTEGTFKPLEKPAHLPDKPHDIPHPAPPGVPDTSNRKEPPAKTILDDDLPSHSHHDDHDHSDDESEHGIISPFHAAFLSFSMIIFAEIGDKTFLVACLMAMRHPRLLVFSAAFSALIAMTVLSALFGHAVPHLISEKFTHAAAAALFLFFGVKLLREGLHMDPGEGVGEEMKEVEMELEQKEHSMARRSSRRTSQISPYALEAGIRVGRRSRSDSRLPTHRSPSSSPERSPSPSSSFRGVTGLVSGANNLFSLLLSPAWVQTFVMTFFGEWGDRSQIATIAMAAGQDYWFVTIGAVLGHAACTGLAVVGGRIMAGWISMRKVTLGGGVAFLGFAVLYAAEAAYHP